MPPEGDDDGLFLDRQNRRFGLLRACREIGDGGALPPLRHPLLIDAIASGQRPQALLTMLYRSTDRLCRRGAQMKILAHSASFHSLQKCTIKIRDQTPRPMRGVLGHGPAACDCELNAKAATDQAIETSQALIKRHLLPRNETNRCDKIQPSRLSWFPRPTPT